MAWLEKHRTSGRFQICIRWNGEKLRKTLPVTDQKIAEATLVRFEENLALLERGRLEMPVDADLLTFLLSDGKLTKSPMKTDVALPKTIKEIIDAYLSALGNGSVEANSLATTRLHLAHIREHLGESFKIKELTGALLQGFIDQRCRRKGKKTKPLSSYTIRKEVGSFRACFNWAVANSLISGTFPNLALRYPKSDEKLPFMTWDEIVRRIERNDVANDDAKLLWDCLFLDIDQVDVLLQHVEATAAHRWIYPMFVCAAHTGARRSELLRLTVDDVDFEGKSILIHEKKRVKGKRTTRRVPMSPTLEIVLAKWIKTEHPGGAALFCHNIDVVRSKTTRTAPTGITRDEAQHHFEKTMKGSKWAVVRGWHAFRHSFASNLAAKGIDQRIIDEFMGHQTEEQRKRYRHLFPHLQRSAICEVFARKT